MWFAGDDPRASALLLHYSRIRGSRKKEVISCKQLTFEKGAHFSPCAQAGTLAATAFFVGAGVCFNDRPDEKGTETAIICHFLSNFLVVSMTDPTQRGLKRVQLEYPETLNQQVSMTDPTKRGLKQFNGNKVLRFFLCFNDRPDEKGTETALVADRFILPAFCFNDRPDKKGTETHVVIAHWLAELGVSMTDPTKRGLKLLLQSVPNPRAGSFNDRPDEKGTQTLTQHMIVLSRWVCFNDRPDEKGTETPFFGAGSAGEH